MVFVIHTNLGLAVDRLQLRSASVDIINEEITLLSTCIEIWRLICDHNHSHISDVWSGLCVIKGLLLQ